MENIQKSILEIKKILENSSEVENSFNKQLLNIIETLVNKVEEIQVNMETLDENLSLINDDLSEVQDELFEEVTLEELDEYNDEYEEVTCTHCNKPIYVEKLVIESNKDIPCPYCNKLFKI